MRAGTLCLLPDPKLTDKRSAIASVQHLAQLPGIEAVLCGDGYPVFRDGAAAIERLVKSLK